MFGIGPMLPVVAAAEDMDNRAARKARKGKQRHHLFTGNHELSIFRRPSTIKTQITLVESEIEASASTAGLATSKEILAVQSPERAPHHQRDLSLTMNWTEKDFERMARELKDEVISDLDLSLFAFWIKAKHENYLFATILVRELALDQGYNIDRISNMHVRKLLQEIHDVRPRFVPGEVHSPTLAASDSSHHDRQKSLSQVLSPAIARGKVWFAAIGESGKEKSDKNKLRDSQRTPAWESPFQTETPAPKMRSVGNTRAVPSPLTARLEILPPSLRLERERAVQEAARATMVSNDATDYPPNTPDRPAPLSVRSRGSLASKMSPLPNTILRSVSTPIRTQPKEDHMPLPHARSITMARGDNTLSPASTNVAKDSASEVFESIHGRGGKHSNLFFEELANSDDRHRGSSDWYAYNNADEDHLRGPFQLDASDVASESSYGTFSSLMRGDKGRASSGVTYEGGCIGNDSFDALESYVGSEDEDDCSLLESASVISEQEACTQYQFAVQSPISNTIVAGPAPTSSQRRAAVDARSKSQVPSFVTPAMNFHRPLPLRSYESEATMFPTAGAQASSGRNRAKSVTSIIASRRHATELMRIPSQPGSSQNSDSPTSIAQEDYERDDSNTKISEQVDRYGLSVSQRSSNASTLAAFPIPSMDNPVGELPMLISRATSSPQTLHSTPSQQPVVSTSVGDAYRAITKFHMVATLQRTRNRGKQLQIIEWDKLSSFEQAWRVVNDLLLVTIYGRNDVFLSETDVAYVDCIARDLRGASGQDVPADWIRRIFEATCKMSL